jgi:hypothetical protein
VAVPGSVQRGQVLVTVGVGWFYPESGIVRGVPCGASAGTVSVAWFPSLPELATREFVFGECIP